MQCDMCRVRPATKDAVVKGMGKWAYMCDRCFQFHGAHVKGAFTTLANIGKGGA